MTQLEANGVRLSYGGPVVVKDLSFSPTPGAITSIVGPNGCGKSTLLRGMARLMKADKGGFVINGSDIASLPTKQIARKIGLLPQQPLIPEGMTVVELVQQGRNPHRRFGQRVRAEDIEFVAEALEMTNTVELAERRVEELSGGQRQRVWIALALAQRTDVLLLDEPTSFLDIAHQLDLLELVTEVNRTRGTTVVMVLHDIGLAARFSDQLVAMRDGSIVADGSPREVLTEELLQSVFDVEAGVIHDPATDALLVVPRRVRHANQSEGQPTHQERNFETAAI